MITVRVFYSTTRQTSPSKDFVNAKSDTRKETSARRVAMTLLRIQCLEREIFDGSQVSDCMTKRRL